MLLAIVVVFLVNISLSAGLKTFDVGLNGFDGRAVCFGDFNGDLEMDLVILSNDQQEFTLFLWKKGISENHQM
jgi:hypothetical protein